MLTKFISRVMDFTFPEDKVLQYGTLKQYLKINNDDIFELIDICNPKSNQIQINGIDYFFTYLDETGNNKGGNSVILKLFNAQNINASDPIYDEPDSILKIHKYKKKRVADKSQKRFEREIQALFKCKKANFENVILIEHSGVCSIFNYKSKVYDKYLYYTMEFAPYDLKGFIENNHNYLSIDDKIKLCIELAKGLKELRLMKLYHRDIKPDNIFMNNLGNWKIGDLGLIDDRNINFSLDKVAEPIGPRGWMSPESMNKYLTEGKGFDYKYNCEIDHQSDIFQLGKVFWYIFQHNAPIGTIKENDFYFKNSQLYSIIKTMLNHSKIKRYKDIDEVIKLLKIQETKLLKSGMIS
jgi:serine/threonine protein kinase